MALDVAWSQTALDDIESIAAYIHKDSPFYAKAVIEKLLASSQLIAQFPKIGRVVPEFNHENIRERFVYSYRLIYEIQDSQLSVLTIVHGKRLLDVAQ